MSDFIWWSNFCHKFVEMIEEGEKKEGLESERGDQFERAISKYNNNNGIQPPRSTDYTLHFQ